MSYPAIAKALVAAKKAMPDLRKGDRNAHGNYAYVSIDAYYEHAASVVTANGLTWKIRELSSEILELGKGAVKTAYSVDVIHEEGEVWMDFFQATVIHPIQGAQTAGSSLSYLDKLFLRTTFSIVTGEKDADDTDNTLLDLGPASVRGGSGKAKASSDPFAGLGPEPAAAEPVRAEEKKGQGSDFVTLAATMVDLAQAEQELTKYWNDNEAQFNGLKTSDPEAYKRLIAKFKNRKQELTKGAAA